MGRKGHGVWGRIGGYETGEGLGVVEGSSVVGDKRQLSILAMCVRTGEPERGQGHERTEEAGSRAEDWAGWFCVVVADGISLSDLPTPRFVFATGMQRSYLICWCGVAAHPVPPPSSSSSYHPCLP